MACMHNYVRSRKGLGSLVTRSLLKRSANSKSLDIIRCRDFSPQACGRETFFFPKRVGYARGCWGAGENIAWGSGSLGSVRSIMRAWLYSAPHRENILKSRSRDKGWASSRVGSRDTRTPRSGPHTSATTAELRRRHGRARRAV